MAESILSFVLGKLGDAFVEEVLHLYGVGKQVEKVSRELIRMQAFLIDADTKRFVDERQKQWVKEVRELAYWIEDAIDVFLLTVPEKKPGKREAVKRLFLKTKKLPAVHILGDEINKIEARIKEIEESRVRYGINNLGEGVDGESGQPVKRIVLPDVDEEGIVGFEADRDEILSLLLDKKNKRRSVISIVGQGGLGKTTLARKVYNSGAAKQQFPIRIWVVISQKFNSIDILGKIADEFKIEPPRDLNDYDRLTKLRQSLQETKYLIILDDIWGEEFWKQIEEVIPDGKNGSRILITTRFEKVALAADPMSVPYKLPVLTEKSSLKLFFKKALPNSNTNERYSDDLKDIGKKIAKKCGGLPLALRVMGGLLSTKPAASWRAEMEKMDWGNDGEECSAIIGTSYDDLSFALKSCFMYFAVFPEDYEIDARSLLRMWVAEGFIPQRENKTLEDTAEMFLEDLVQRSMIQVSKRDYYGGFIKRCRIHDLLHDLATRKAREENSLVVFPKTDGVRRLAIHDKEPCDELMASLDSNLRSLWCRERLPNVSLFTRLKVLSGTTDLYEPDKFGKLSLLRYVKVRLAVYSKDKDYFGKFIGGMRFLQTLDLRGSYICELPDFVWNLKTLRHILLPGDSLGPPPLIDLRNLQTLRGVKPRESWVAQGSPKLPNVKYLEICVPKAQGGVQWDAVVTLLNTMKYLVVLYLWGPDIPLKIFDMRHFLLRCHLTNLTIFDTSRGDEDEEQRAQPPNQIVLDVGMLPKYLIKLELTNIKFREDPFPVAEMLENLRYLHLQRSKLLVRLCCSARGFGKLEQLELFSLTGLEEWEIEEGAMPMLKNLDVDRCPGLRVPLGLQYLTVLQKLNWSKNQTSENEKNEIRSICKHVPDLKFWKW
ncbi:Disease resistance family protein [Rhynchospora pubera]|uniref:Disease resistance family protein n=1 Tax=Rhynchospora pubera TaxID=906938 RepID=A0AAV8CQT6_9POAL|nr:Disease resistance family protein [Rhynchospora pubera]